MFKVEKHCQNWCVYIPSILLWDIEDVDQYGFNIGAPTPDRIQARQIDVPESMRIQINQNNALIAEALQQEGILLPDEMNWYKKSNQTDSYEMLQDIIKSEAIFI